MKPAGYPEQPAHLWQHFYEISQIPRPSGSEGRLRDHVVELAGRLGCETRVDAAGNLVVRVPGRGALAGAPTLIIQNHLDMVTVKTDDKVHDFHSDALELRVDGEWLCADRTTLGADNGVGCAAALALMTDDSLVHPPLELLFTVEEETGLFGAADLDASLLTGRRMLNLDTEDWGELFVGCAGGRGWQLRRPLQRQPGRAGQRAWQLTLRGLAGGHSGLQIHEQLGNAVKLLGEWLVTARELGLRVIAFDGGVAHNVIPREACLTFLCDADEAALTQLNDRLRERWLSYLPGADSALELELRPAVPDLAPLAPADQTRLEQLVLLFPHGAMSYSAEQPADLVDLSINLAVLRVDADGLFLETTLRYFNEGQAEGLAQRVLAIAEWLDADVTDTVDYPGWEPDFDSALLAETRACYEDLFGVQPAVKAIHAGLECGILKSKKPDVDIVSFGPTIRGAHSPTERLAVATVAPFWSLLTTLVTRLD